MHDGVHQIHIGNLPRPLCIFSTPADFLFELTHTSSARARTVLVLAQIMALVLTPWCGRRARPFSCGRPSVFTDLVIIKVPHMMMPRQACGRSQAVQWTETPESHVFKLRLPGMKKEDVRVQVEDDRTLYISYSDHQLKGEAKEGEGAATSDKLQKHAFMRKFKLPENAEAEQIKAEVADEILTVTVPKRRMDARRVIEVSEGAYSLPAASSTTTPPSEERSVRFSTAEASKPSTSTA